MFMYSIIITLFCIISLTISALILYREGYLFRILGKLGVIEYKPKRNWAVFSWNNMAEKLDMEADIVFLGDSITRGSNFHKRYPNKKIINLGLSGDTLSGMLTRVQTIKAFNPKQIFILGGINGLTNLNIDKSIKTYSRLLKKIKSSIPDAKIYVQTVLPISKAKEKNICKNKTIIIFNKMLSELATEYGVVFIDLHTSYFTDGVLNPELTVDGLHLYPFAYDKWENILDDYIN